MTIDELAATFDIEIVLEPEKGCWLIANRDWSIYTTIHGERAHRLVYKTCKGPLIDGREICHDCDRKGCINPDHLYQGTHAQNMHDAINRKRLSRPTINIIPSKLNQDLEFLHNQFTQDKISYFKYLKLCAKVKASWARFYKYRR